MAFKRWSNFQIPTFFNGDSMLKSDVGSTLIQHLVPAGWADFIESSPWLHGQIQLKLKDRVKGLSTYMIYQSLNIHVMTLHHVYRARHLREPMSLWSINLSLASYIFKTMRPAGPCLLIHKPTDLISTSFWLLNQYIFNFIWAHEFRFGKYMYIIIETIYIYFTHNPYIEYLHVKQCVHWSVKVRAVKLRAGKI